VIALCRYYLPMVNGSPIVEAVILKILKHDHNQIMDRPSDRPL
jgi:hypothetical protein